MDLVALADVDVVDVDVVDAGAVDADEAGAVFWGTACGLNDRSYAPHSGSRASCRSFRGHRLPWLSNLALKVGMLFTYNDHKNVARHSRKSVAME